MLSAFAPAAAAYEVHSEDSSDRILVWSVMPAMVHYGRGLTLGGAANVDVRLAPMFRIDLGGQVPYLSLAEQGPFGFEAVIAVGTNRERNVTTNVTLDQSAARPEEIGMEQFSTYTERYLRDVEVTTRRQLSVRLGTRLYHGLLFGRLYGGLWQAVAGVQWRDMRSFTVESNGYEPVRRSAVVTAGLEALVALDRTPEPDSEGFDPTVWERLGFRATMRLGSHRPLGFGLDCSLGYNGAGAGWFLLFGLGLAGAL